MRDQAQIDRDLKEFQAIKARRSPWEKIWELIARYVLSRKQGFVTTISPGDFLVHGDVYDDTATRALNTAVSSLAGSLWKNGARTFRLVRPDEVPDTEATKKYYAEVNRRTWYHMDHERAGFGLAFQESMIEDVGFGTSAIGVFSPKDKTDNLLEFQPWSLKGLYVVEGASGTVAKLFYELEWDAFRIVAEYGDIVQNVPDIKACLDTNNYEKKFKIVLIIRPRSNFDPNIKNNLNKPYESIHILQNPKMDLRESGYDELPVKVSRLHKNQDEEYGRGLALDALPSIMELNAIWEIVTKAAEKALLPPLYLLDDGSFGGGTIDTSPNALNVIDVGSRISNTAPIGVIGTTGEMNPTIKLIETLNAQIMSHFYVDRLLDLNNQTRMTLGEAQIRNELRSESVGALYSRQIAEKLTPVIDRSISILWEEGELGVQEGGEKWKALTAIGKVPLIIPPEVQEVMAKGQHWYRLEYISPAARILRSEELRGVMSTWQFVGTYAPMKPYMVLMLDEEKSLRLVTDLTGSPDILLSDEMYQQAKEEYDQAQAEAMRQRMAAANADAAAKAASANQQNAQAQATAMGGSMAAGIA